MITAFDIFDNEVQIGDTIAWAYGYRGTSLTDGDITNIKEEEIDDSNSWDPNLRKYTKTIIVPNVQVRYPDGVRRWLGVGRQFVRKP